MLSKIIYLYNQLYMCDIQNTKAQRNPEYRQRIMYNIIIYNIYP